ncbi:hypothetical protein O181_052843 [Austropuccinia psidii MF-1]|uniref:SAM domain-containing protein n=1 Tax=Austropuccinia psidii MF-1 TaxID=1389203 RepID=A0A9Q3HPU7_9BASI|nr:hypothetical protein [Austropuccinia psidii MF-1]
MTSSSTTDSSSKKRSQSCFTHLSNKELLISPTTSNFPPHSGNKTGHNSLSSSQGRLAKSACFDIKSSTQPNQWTFTKVIEWGKSRGLDDFTPEKFVEHEITGDVLLELDVNSLKETDLSDFGHRVRVMKAIEELKKTFQTHHQPHPAISPFFEQNQSSSSPDPVGSEHSHQIPSRNETRYLSKSSSDAFQIGHRSSHDSWSPISKPFIGSRAEDPAERAIESLNRTLSIDVDLNKSTKRGKIIYHPRYVEDVVNFFQPPASQLESVGALINVAVETLEGIRQDMRAGFVFSLQTHKTLDIKVDINAPIVIIPQDVTLHDCQHIILDAGHISDKFRVELKLLLGKSLEQCLSALDEPKGYAEIHLIERISLSFNVFNCIVDNTPSLTRFKVQGDLPQLRVNFSDNKYRILMSMIEVALPRFTSSQGSTGYESLNKLKNFPADPNHAPLKSTQSKKAGFGMSSLFLDDSSFSFDLGEDAQGNESIQQTTNAAQEDEFFEVPELLQEEQSLNFRRNNFQLEFTVGKLILSIFKTDKETGEDQKLVDSVLEGFFFV